MSKIIPQVLVWIYGPAALFLLPYWPVDDSPITGRVPLNFEDCIRLAAEG